MADQNFSSEILYLTPLLQIISIIIIISFMMADVQSNIVPSLPDTIVQEKDDSLTPRTELMDTSRSALSQSQETTSTEPDQQQEIIQPVELYDADDEKQAEALVAASVVSQKLHKFDEAIANLHGAMKIYTKLNGRNHKNVAKTLNSLGNCLFDAERYEDSLSKYQEALEVCKASTGDVSVETANVYQNMSRVLFKLERFQEALDMNSEAVAIKTQIPTTSTLVASDKPKKFVAKKKESNNGCGCSLS